MKENELTKMPLLPIRDPNCVVFPVGYYQIGVGREFSTKAIEIAKHEYNSRIIMATQRKSEIDDPKPKDIWGMGVEVKINNIKYISKDNSKMEVRFEGLKKVKIHKINNEEGVLFGYVEDIVIKDEKLTEDDIEAVKYIRDIIREKTKLQISTSDLPKTTVELSQYLDYISYQLDIPAKDRFKLVSTLDPRKRLKPVFIALESSILTKIEEMETKNKDNRNALPRDLAELRDNLHKAKIPEKEFETVKEEFRRLLSIPPNNSEYNVSFSYLTYISKLPWSNTTEDNLDVSHARKVLDEDHYGMKNTKERILEYLSVRKLNKTSKGSIVCLHGPCGTGKTSIGKSIARAMGRKFVRISLGGVSDEAEIRGHRRTYVGAIAGRIIESLKKVGTRNPVFMLDEVDKLSSNFRGDPSAALLEVLDPEQNNSFTDNYLALPFDLSQVFFICTVNSLATIAPALRDRLEIINVSGYSLYDKLQIASKYLIPKQRKNNGIDENIEITQNALSKIIEEYTSEAGVRSLDRSCGTIMRKMAVLIAGNKERPKQIRVDAVPKYLGPPKAFSENKVETPEVGLSTGLAWSNNGGSILFVETTLTDGKGDVKLTGNLGKVLQESARTAYTFIKANREFFGINKKMFNKDVHIHFPAGAVPKDGPSAGIAIASAMISAFLNKPVSNNIAMTGEITLRGRVLPIGGLREKILAAHRAGINHVIFPEQNKHDIDELPEDVKNNMTFTLAKKLTDIINLLLVEEGENNEEISVSDEQMVNMEW